MSHKSPTTQIRSREAVNLSTKNNNKYYIKITFFLRKQKILPYWNYRAVTCYGSIHIFRRKK
ncbi:MAG: FMN-binding negative transcriptional regulator [Tenericutes bacterium]|nr:FMN-binding negative transcriptional regulator [Mycoplasmatota bacterium]